MTPTDVARAREILAAQIPAVDQSGDLSDRVALAIAQGIAEGRAEGIKQGVQMTAASNDA
ncbi:hypothetical protein [Bradyrhizobium sp. dw_78]|uniref:hypothetical protein n=1 Tax=Bradyrhizobium sp. dw_78 TaxID=2719793 RepID=UPI001BD262D0|nr:hypothetical protein [Bradyrhizobium sp. dw_78]